MQQTRKTPLYKNLTVQVLAAIVLGVVFGHLAPSWGVEMKPFGDLFIKLIKMVIGPIVFLTVVIGISAMGDIKKVGRVGGKAILYFEVITTLALILGVATMHIFRPGDGLDVSKMEHGDVSKYVTAAQHQSTLDFLMHIIPDNMVGAFANGDMLQVLFVAILFGFALSHLGEKGKMVEDFCERIANVFFGIIGFVMKVAPLGAFGAMAYTVGTFGIESLLPLLKLMGVAILTLAIFVFGVLGAVAYMAKFSLWQLIKVFKDELFIVLGTGSSEPVLPKLLEKLEAFGCSRAVVGLVVPSGYSFNLDGSTIYLSMCAIFIAQAFQVEMTLWQELSLIGILMVTSKGAAAVAGSGFIVLAATIQATGFLPLEGLALILGIDRFMSSARAVTNVIGNAVATVVVAKWEKEFDAQKSREYVASLEGETGEAASPKPENVISLQQASS
ncbi:MAG: dicarboxylate/amino acid:cation symporter [Alphaproteobacteria bacterium]|nr:dicarboxylate/amino acid:cation symporter [Alphaproteobacteria bacterium]